VVARSSDPKDYPQNPDDYPEAKEKQAFKDANKDGLYTLGEYLSYPMRNRIKAKKARHDELLKKLQEGGDQTALGKEVSQLSGISSLCDKLAEIHEAREALLELKEETSLIEFLEGPKAESWTEEDTEELMADINAELADIECEKLPPLAQKLMKAIVPVLNPEDLDDLTSSDAVIDIRAGTGGDEACLFAGEMLAGYQAIAKSGGADESGSGGKSWDVEILSVSRTDLGGVKEASLVVSARGGGGGGYGGYGGGSGDDFESDEGGFTDAERTQRKNDSLLKQLGPYGFFQFESGVHRVQRVPVNDVKMQTSAVSVAVLPSVPENKIAAALPPSELRIDTMRASGAGGQHVNTTDSAVRVTHIPTGIVANMQEERSQHKNKAKALRLVAARVHQRRKEEELKKRSSARSSLMGGGDRSERIRTYNYPQDRITDHRCKVSVSGVQNWLGGGMTVRKFGPYMYDMEREERVNAMEEEDAEEEARKPPKGKSKRGPWGTLPPGIPLT